eukprot:NODE_98_length_2583_cov_60.101815_g65_i0.p1 GENE.NODE_98_length_2583_cov_60.101815_g65_i0~~NODE_98_length_2583_cov_60.101815_g65_i0.p1  ORF type:complete len:773 (+),score=197.52 NODE_98_length_2583_cov_60.101815_g65_i0:80-2398(+)
MDDDGFGFLDCTHPEESVQNDGGQQICLLCGLVLDDANLAADVNFDSGQLVGGAGGNNSKFIPSAGRRNRVCSNEVSSESREFTLAKARNEFNRLASDLSLAPHQVERAVRVYDCALNGNCVHGRKNFTVIAACLYVVCRQMKTPHMLMDFSETLKESVWAIAHTYTQLVDTLGLEIPPVDPSLYIKRFTAKLNVGDDLVHPIAATALKLISRMQRDWIQVGRRPAGVVAAALVIACRAHGRPVTVDQVVRVVRIHETTLRKRLVEIQHTASKSLSLNQLHDADKEEDEKPFLPPSFVRLRRLEQLQGIALSDDSDDACERRRQRQSKRKANKSKRAKSKPKPKKGQRKGPRTEYDSSSEDSAAELLEVLASEHDHGPITGPLSFAQVEETMGPNRFDSTVSVLTNLEPPKRAVSFADTVVSHPAPDNDSAAPIVIMPCVVPPTKVQEPPAAEEEAEDDDDDDDDDWVSETSLMKPKDSKEKGKETVPPAKDGDDDGDDDDDDDGDDWIAEDDIPSDTVNITDSHAEELQALLDNPDLKQLDRMVGNTNATEDAVRKEKARAAALSSLEPQAAAGLDDVLDTIPEEDDKVNEEDPDEVVESLSDVSDTEINEYLITDEDELEKRAWLWDELHGKFLLEMKARLEKRRQEAEDRLMFGRTRKRKAAEEEAEDGFQDDGTAVTATARALKKRSSNNINYTVLEDLFNAEEDENFAAMDRDDGADTTGAKLNDILGNDDDVDPESLLWGSAGDMGTADVEDAMAAEADDGFQDWG